MNTKHWRGAVAGVVLGMILVACGAGRTMVMEAPAEQRTFTSATVEDGKDSVAMPEEFRTRLTEKVKEGLYGDAEKPGSFKKEGDGLTIRLKVVQFDSGSQFQRWLFGGIGNQGEASMHVLAEFYDGDKKTGSYPDRRPDRQRGIRRLGELGCRQSRRRDRRVRGRELPLSRRASKRRD